MVASLAVATTSLTVDTAPLRAIARGALLKNAGREEGRDGSRPFVPDRAEPSLSARRHSSSAAKACPQGPSLNRRRPVGQSSALTSSATG